MNLIEQLGGYEKAKECLNHKDSTDAQYFVLGYGYISNITSCGASDSQFVNATKHENGEIFPITFNSYFNTVDSLVSFETTIDLDQLNVELLEYRRANNIFEVGDYVFHTVCNNPLLEKITWTDGVRIITNLAGRSTLIETFRHATDAEIAAGKRL